MSTVMVYWNSKIYNRYKNIYTIKLFEVIRQNRTTSPFWTYHDYNDHNYYSETTLRILDPFSDTIKELADGTIEIRSSSLQNNRCNLSPADIVMEVPEDLYTVYNLALYSVFFIHSFSN